MFAELQDEDQIIERVAALDIEKAEVVCCVRLPGAGRRRVQEVSPAARAAPGSARRSRRGTSAV